MYKINRFHKSSNLFDKIEQTINGNVKYLKYLMPFGRIIDKPLYWGKKNGKSKYISRAIVLNKDGSLQTTFRYRGPDLESSVESELAMITGQLNTAFQMFRTGWAIYFEAQRVPAMDYPENGFFPDRVTKKIDEIRRNLFQDGSHFESNYYVTFYWLPPSDKEGKLREFVIDGTKRKNSSIDNKMEYFLDLTNKMFMLLGDLKFPVEYMNIDEMATYLHSTVSENNYNIHLTNSEVLLDHILYDSSLSGGFDPILGKKHLRVIVPVSYGNSTSFGLFDELNKLGFSYRWVTRFYCLSKTDSIDLLKEFRSAWNGKIKSLMTTVKELFFGMSSNFQVNENAVFKVREIKDAILVAEADQTTYGFYSTMLVVMDEDEELLDEKVGMIEQIFVNLGMQVKTESLNAVDAWLGSIPGNVNHQERRPIISTGNLVHMIPLSDIWAGEVKNKHLNAPSLLYTETGGNSPYRLNIHVGEVGHTMIVGPTGAGKSVLLNIIEAQFRKYKDAQIFIFDKGSSSRILTEAVGGNFYDLGNEKTALSFQPLANIDDEKEREWVYEWLCDFCEEQKKEGILDAATKNKLWDALGTLKVYSDAKEHRTMLTLYNNLTSDVNLRDIIKQLTESGPYGKIFDSNKDDLSFTSWQSFEMEKLMETKQIVCHTLMYIFHRIEQQLTGRPTIIVLDECWIFFDNPIFVAKIREWLKTLRKLNTSVIFATQSLADIVKSPILDTVLESCPSKMFLPFKKATEANYKKTYERFGLNEKQIKIIADSTPQRQYYYTSPLGSRKFELSLSRFELAYFGVNKEDLNECERILDSYGKENFAEKWEAYKGVGGKVYETD
jgi:type IV secretion system protein TrbE